MMQAILCLVVTEENKTVLVTVVRTFTEPTTYGIDQAFELLDSKANNWLKTLVGKGDFTVTFHDALLERRAPWNKDVFETFMTRRIEIRPASWL